MRSIDGSYSSSCYRQAMQNAPTDLRIYSTLEDDLQTALRVHTGRRLAAAPARAATIDLSGTASSFSTLVALLVGLAGLLALSSFAAAVARRRAGP